MGPSPIMGKGASDIKIAILALVITPPFIEKLGARTDLGIGAVLEMSLRGLAEVVFLVGAIKTESGAEALSV